MTTFEAVETLELNDDASWEEKRDALQSLIDSGVVWQLQGSYGRMAQRAIEDGVCQPAGAVWPCGRRECIAHATGRDCRES
jgi:hypothetical protein